MKTNTALPKQPPLKTHEGGPAVQAPNAATDLRRAVMSHMLWENEFYESGVTITDRIKALVPLVSPEVVAYFALKARTDMKLRHAPLLLVREMARATPAHRRLVGRTLAQVVQRADELTEFLALYWKDDPNQPLSAQVKIGLAAAFPKFSEYDLAKYNRDGRVKLRDVLFLCHAKPLDVDADRVFTKEQRKAGKRAKTPQEKLFQKVVDNTLETPDTWEVEFSAIGDTEGLTAEQKVELKRGKWVRLLEDRKLGALAVLRNLRNMQEVGVPPDVIEAAIMGIDVKRVLPHRFIAAARYAPNFEDKLEAKMLDCATAMPKLAGRTLWLIDVSGSMDYKLSSKSDLTRLDAACGLAMIGREVCEMAAVCTFSNDVAAVPNRRGFALRDAIVGSQPHQGTYLGGAVELINKDLTYDRVIVVTDEQTADRVPAPRAGAKGYMINVASNKNGVGYGTWNKLDGFSEAIVGYIAEFEKEEQ